MTHFWTFYEAIILHRPEKPQGSDGFFRADCFNPLGGVSGKALRKYSAQLLTGRPH
jgi:hypothetical protein